MDAEILAQLAKDVRRMGAAFLLHQHGMVSQRFANHPLWVGANGEEEEEERRGLKRSRPEPTPEERQALAALAPQWKRLAASAQDDPEFGQRVIEVLVQFPSEIWVRILQFLLQFRLPPRFPTVWRTTVGDLAHKTSEDITMMSARDWVNDQVLIMNGAFKSLVVHSLRLHNTADARRDPDKDTYQEIYRELLSVNFRLRMYRAWLARDGYPLVVREDGVDPFTGRLLPGDRYPGPRFSDAELKDLFSQLPLVLRLHWRPLWYEHYVADVAMHWYIGAIARTQWRRGLADPMKPPDVAGNLTGSDTIWGGANLDPRVEFGFGPDVGEERALVNMGAQDVWLNLDGFRSKRLVTENVFQRMARQMYLTSLIRVPSILWDREKYPQASAIVGGYLHQPYLKRKTTFDFGDDARAPFLVFDPPLRAHKPGARGPFGFSLLHRPLVQKAELLALARCRLLSMLNAGHGLGRWLRSVVLEQSTLALVSLTRPVRKDAKPLRIYLPPRLAADVFAEGGRHTLLGNGVVLVVGEEGAQGSPALIRNRAGDPLDEYMGYKSAIVVMVGPEARELLQGMAQRFRPKWAGWGQLSETPRFLAKIQMPYLDAVQAAPSDEGDVTMTDAARRIVWHK